MLDEILTFGSSLLIGLASSAATVAGGYWLYRSRVRDAEATETVAEISSHAAIAEMQVEYAQAYKLLAEQATAPIEKLMRRVNELEKSDMEKSDRIASLEKELIAVKNENEELKKKVASLEEGKKQSRSRADRMQVKLNKIKRELDAGTGPLATGKHNIPKDDE